MKPKILVPFDFSPEAARALAWAVDFAGTTHGTVHALHLVSMLPSLSMIGPLPAAGAATADMEGLQRELAERVARASSTATSSVSVCVSFGESVVTAAVDGGFDLIVMGTHGRGALARLALGSVADYVVRHATVPVVTMRVPAITEV